MAKNKEHLQHALEVIRQFIAHQKLPSADIMIDANGASWTTAATTGALGYMGYAEAKKSTRAYDLQSMLLRNQEDRFRTAAQALASVKFSAGGPDTMSDEQLRSVERDVLACLAELSYWEQIAAQLSDEYGRVLTAK